MATGAFRSKKEIAQYLRDCLLKAEATREELGADNVGYAAAYGSLKGAVADVIMDSLPEYTPHSLGIGEWRGQRFINSDGRQEVVTQGKSDDSEPTTDDTE